VSIDLSRLLLAGVVISTRTIVRKRTKSRWWVPNPTYPPPDLLIKRHCLLNNLSEW